MKRLLLIPLLFTATEAVADTRTIAAITTIAVNVIEIRSTSAKAWKVWKATRKVTVKAARKVAGK